MGRSHDHYCVRCKAHWSPLDFPTCPGCGSDEDSEYDLNHDAEDRNRSPLHIAEGAINRLCVYNGEDSPTDWQATAERIAEFQREFTLIAGERLANVATKAQTEKETSMTPDKDQVGRVG